MTQIRQGDVLLIKVRSIPRTADVAAPDDHIPDRVILAYGEATGHHHSLDAKVARLYDQEQKRFLRVTSATMLVHQEHEHILVPKGDYLVVRQMEYTPKEVRRVQD